MPIPTFRKDALKVIPLGGCGEIGKNMTVLEYNDDIIVVDCGFMFPPDEMLGIDFVIPDITYLVANQAKIRGMIITHGHEDHVGAIPYVLPKISPPIYTAKLTAGLIDVKLQEFTVRKPQINIVKAGDKIRLGAFGIEFFHLNHSIPDCLGLAITTPEGLVVYATDFKFDPTPVDGRKTDFEKLKEFGRRGVLLTMTDSTNTEVPGHTPSEQVIGKAIDNIFTQAKGRIIVTSFASVINRIQQVIDASVKHNRLVAISGRSMIRNVEIATKLGYLRFPKNVVIPIQKAAKVPDSKLTILCTGSQGEELSALVRMASGDHKQIKIKKGDTVVISASPIPGNENSVFGTINNLYREGAEVIYGKEVDVHVSGHASKEDLKMMLQMLKPRFFMPIHGEYRHLHLHGHLAQTMGIKPENILVLENGDVAEVTRNSIRKADKKVPSGIVMVDGLGVGDVGNIVLRDRQAMATEGIFVVIVTVDKQTGKLLSSPDIISRGFVYMRESEELIRKTREEVKRAVADRAQKYPANWSFFKSKIRDDLTEFLYNHTKRRPMVLPVVIEV